MKKRKIYWQSVAFSLALLLVLTMIVKPVAYAKSSKSGTSVTKLTVKTTGTMLNEGQVLTKSMLKKSLKATARLKNGTIKKKYTSYKSKQIGKTIKPNSKGKYKVTITAGSAKKAVSIKVNRITKIYFKNPKPKTLTEGEKFDTEAFKKDYTVYAGYKKGADKKLTTYTVSVPDVVKADANGKFDVTVKYGKYTATISMPVTKAISTENTTTEDTSQEQPTPGQPTVGEDPKPEPSVPGTTTTQRPAEPIKVYFFGDKYKLNPQASIVYIYVALDSPEDSGDLMTPKFYTRLDFGYLYTTEDLDEDTMIVGSIAKKEGGITSIRNTELTSNIHFAQELWDANATVKVRAYAIVQTVEGTEETIYSDILSFQLESE